MKDNKQKTVYTLSFYKNNFKRTMRFIGKKKTEKEHLRLKSIQKTFYPSLEDRNVLQLTNKYQEINNLQGEV